MQGGKKILPVTYKITYTEIIARIVKINSCMDKCFGFTIVGADGCAVGPCVLFHLQQERLTNPVYVFGCPEGKCAQPHLFEGLSRLALEHRTLRPSMGHVAAVLAHRASFKHCGGLSGLILR